MALRDLALHYAVEANDIREKDFADNPDSPMPVALAAKVKRIEQHMKTLREQLWDSITERVSDEDLTRSGDNLVLVSGNRYEVREPDLGRMFGGMSVGATLLGALVADATARAMADDDDAGDWDGRF